MTTALEIPDGLRRSVTVVGLSTVAAVGGAAVGAAVDMGLWFVVAGGLVAPIGMAIAHRRPELVFVLWILLDPLVNLVDGGGPYRRVYWLVHRAMPVVVLAVILAQRVTGTRRLPKLGWPELLMVGYVIASMISITYTSPTALASTYHLYDRVVIPMTMYLLIRFMVPTGRQLATLLPALAFLLVSQTVFGALSWVAPGLLPNAWLDRAGTRTTGSLGHPNVYGTTVLAAGLLLFHIVMSRSGARRRTWIAPMALFVSAAMAILTLSRASWLAALVALIGVALMYRKAAIRLVVISTLMIGLFAMSPYFGPLADQIRARAYSEQSEESALSRLPVVIASIRMFQDRPIAGFGYENFDYFDLQYVSSVGELFLPDRDHASHNLYLTILAEQGLIGFLTYIGPALIWLARSRHAWHVLPTTGFESRRLLVVLWSILAGHVIVNNLSNMKIAFGLSVWWMTLALIGVAVTRAVRPADVDITPIDDGASRHPLRARRSIEDRSGH